MFRFSVERRHEGLMFFFYDFIFVKNSTFVCGITWRATFNVRFLDKAFEVMGFANKYNVVYSFVRRDYNMCHTVRRGIRASAL